MTKTFTLALLSCHLVTLSPCHLIRAGHPEGEPAWAQARQQLQTGMTPEQARTILGPPQRIARQLLFQRYREQWVYLRPGRLRLDFECHKGQKPRLLHTRPPLLPHK